MDWTATRIEHLAKATGIPRATLYYYFPGKEHILAHLLSRTLGQMTAKLSAVAAEPGTGRQRLVRLVHEHLVFIGGHGATYRLLFAELGRAASLVDICRVSILRSCHRYVRRFATARSTVR